MQSYRLSLEAIEKLDLLKEKFDKNGPKTSKAEILEFLIKKEFDKK